MFHCRIVDWKIKARSVASIATVIIAFAFSCLAQQPTQQTQSGATLTGVVSDSQGGSVEGATVRLDRKGAAGASETKTDSGGKFSFTSLEPGVYFVTAQRSASRSNSATVDISSVSDVRTINLILAASVAKAAPGAGPDSSAEAMEFADKPNFTIAGVTDWTAAGGHGSDASLRTSEALTRETVTLKAGDKAIAATAAAPHGAESAETVRTLHALVEKNPESFAANRQLGQYYLRIGRYTEAISFLGAGYRIDSKDRANEQDLAIALEDTGDFAAARMHVQSLLARAETADLHRLAGEIDEKLGDPLPAVHEFELAARQDPSEVNYFEWGSELLLHRAVWQAQEIFRRGAQLFPKSSRMLTGLGAALFAGALYEEAAQRLCDASDLSPADPEPYIFMGKIEMATPDPLPCINQKLTRFAEIEPANALAIYYHAMAVWKQEGRASDPHIIEQVEQMLTKAVTLDPKCAEAYLQLGNLSYAGRKYEKAIGEYRKAIDVNPRMSEAHYRLGMAYDRAGEQASAKQEFDLHDKIEKEQAAEVDLQRRQVKQFLVVEPDKPAATTPH